MSDRCARCLRPFRSTQPGLVAEMSCSQTGNEKCRIAESGIARGRAEVARLTRESEAHFAFRAEVNAALPRPFGTTVIGAIAALKSRPVVVPEEVREALHDASRERPLRPDQVSAVAAWLASTAEVAPSERERIAELEAKVLPADVLATVRDALKDDTAFYVIRSEAERALAFLDEHYPEVSR